MVVIVAIFSFICIISFKFPFYFWSVFTDYVIQTDGKLLINILFKVSAEIIYRLQELSIKPHNDYWWPYNNFAPKSCSSTSGSLRFGMLSASFGSFKILFLFKK